MKRKPHTSGKEMQASLSSNSSWQDVTSPVRALVAHRHMSIKRAHNAKLRPRCRPKTYKTDTSRVVAKHMLAGKSYFEKSSQEQVFIAASAPSALVGHPRGAQLVDVAEALGMPLCPAILAGKRYFAQSAPWSPTGTCQEGQHRTQNSDHVAVP
jgi:hypothetical protein